MVYYPYYSGFTSCDVLTVITILGIIIIVISWIFLILRYDNNHNNSIDTIIPSQSMFVSIEDNDMFCVVYHKQTKVMYTVSRTGTLTLLIDENNKPMIYKGELI